MSDLYGEELCKIDEKIKDFDQTDLQMKVLPSSNSFNPVLQNITMFSKTIYFRGKLRPERSFKLAKRCIGRSNFNSKFSLLKSGRICLFGFIIWTLIAGPLLSDVTRRFFNDSSARHFGVTPAVACHPGHGRGSSRVPGMEVVPFQLHEHIPKLSEQTIGASGPAEGRIELNSARYHKNLVPNFNTAIVFNDEEENNEDRMMTELCLRRLNDLALLVSQRWPNVRLRVTEAWDSEGRHRANSLHYEGRAVDITTSDLDRSKYPVLARLAVNAGFDWVVYNSKSHVHCSVKSESSQAAYNGRCFTGDSLVAMPSGKQAYMSALKPGDDVYAVGSKGQIVTTRILTFLDVQYSAIGIKFVAVRLENGKVLKLTRNHLLYVSSAAGKDLIRSHHVFDSFNVKEAWNKTIPGSNVKLLAFKPTFVGNIKPGQYAYVMETGSRSNISNFTAIPRPHKIVSVTNINSTSGSYAPLTEEGNIIVEDIAASCYATIENEALAHLVITPVRYYHIIKLWLKTFVEEDNLKPVDSYCHNLTLPYSYYKQCELNQGISIYSYILQVIASYVFSNAVFWIA